MNLDVYYSFEYGKTFAEKEGGELRAVYYENENGELFYPFIIRPIPLVEGNWQDIVTPYGYGGPFIVGKDLKKLCKHFYAAFTSFCKENNIVTETIRSHPLLGNEAYLEEEIDLQYIRKTTAVDLTKSLKEIRNDYTKMCKRNIKKARKQGVTCYTADIYDKTIKKFHDMYSETMDRNGADDFYFFDITFFEKQLEGSSIHDSLLLFAEYEKEVIGGVLLLVGREFAHYHFGASTTKYLKLRPNNLIFDYMVEVAKSKGCKALHLGGGYAEDDGLFKFKSSFTNHNHFPYYIGKKIYNHTQYEEITSYVKQNYEVKEQFFPTYRGIIKKVGDTDE